MKKTALQLVIDHFDLAHKTTSDSHRLIFKGIADKLREYLPTEREQIEAAYDQGINDEHDNNNYQEYESAKDYFANTYEHE